MKSAANPWSAARCFHDKVGGIMTRRTWLRVLAVALLTLMGTVNARAASGVCDRACLEGILNQYLNAVVKHDPSAAPLYIAFRQTENAVVVMKGEGVWKSVTGLGKVQRRYIDTVQSSAGYFGTIEEGSEVGIATLRLKIENRKITEAEWVIARSDTGTPQAAGPGSTSPEGLEGSPPPDKILPKEMRTPRDVMIAVTNSYFDAVQTGNNALIIAHPGWVRLENGIGTGMGRGGAARGGAPTGGGGGPGGGGRGTAGMTGVVARRYPIVDEEKGVALGMVMFIRPPGSAARRNLLTEWFAIDSNAIRGIYAAMHYLTPTAMAPNWPPYDGNWPLAPTLPGMDATAGQGGPGRGNPPPAGPGPAAAPASGR
jgi:hypothetical protein